MTPSQRSRSRSQTSAAEENRTPTRASSRQTSVLTSSMQSYQFRDHSPVTPAQSVSSVTRPLSPESFQGTPSFLTSSLPHHVLVTTATPDQTAPNTPQHRPVSTSSVHPTFDPFPAPELCKATQTELLKCREVFPLVGVVNLLCSYRKNPLANAVIILTFESMSFYHRVIEPCHEKTCLCYMRTTKAQISLRIRAVRSVPLLFAAWIV